jgi:hypothetical protein
MKTRIITLLVVLTLTACSVSVSTNAPIPPTVPAIPTQTLSISDATSPTATQALALQPTLTLTVPTATSLPPVIGIYNPYAVILVNPDDVLNVRSGAGVGNSVAGTLGVSVTGVNRTGPASSGDGDRWVEIQSPAGWVNAKFLTEYVPSTFFCSDTRVNDLLTNLKTALLNEDGELFGSLVSPVHGLDARLWRSGTVANYSPEEASWVFQSDYSVSWGPAPGSGAETQGTFTSQLLPKLQEVFSVDFTLHCNDTLDLASTLLEPWPPEYANINFYLVYKPGSDENGGLDWRIWIVGVEYVQGKPTVFSLIHFQWEP